jgi:hypothetical protein
VTVTATTPDELRRAARQAYNRGDFETALRTQIDLVNGHRATGTLPRTISAFSSSAVIPAASASSPTPPSAKRSAAIPPR